MSREHIALLTGRRREPVAPERNLVNDRGKLGTSRKIRLDARGKDDEIECEGAGFGFDNRDVSFVADRVPCAIGMPREIFELATTPKGILGWRLRKLLQNVAHESPALQVGQFSEVTEHAGEVRPEEWIDPGDVRAAEAKVDPCGAGFECRGRIVESRSTDAEHADALSGKPAEVYVVSRMGITLRGEIGDEGSRSPPASAAFNAGCEDDLSRMDAFDPASPAEMGEEKVAGRLDRCYFDLVFDRKLQNIAIPIEIFSPYLWGKCLRCAPMPGDRISPRTRHGP